MKKFSSNLFAGGAGTEDSPYLISNEAELENVRKFLGSKIYFQLVQNIDLSSKYNWMPIGNAKNKFEGMFDGKSYVIRNLVINREQDDFIGLFGYVGSHGRIDNVILADANISGRNFVGGLVGFNCGVIYESYVAGNVFGHDSVGGLVGFNSSGGIFNSYVTGNIVGEHNVGGLIGYNSIGNIHSSYIKGRVIGESYVGGIIGFSYAGNMKKSHATGSITVSDKEVVDLIGTHIGTYS